VRRLDGLADIESIFCALAVLAVLLRESMTNQLSHVNLFSDLSNVTLRRVFETDHGWAFLQNQAYTF
jgi:hypothetical protein